MNRNSRRFLFFCHDSPHPTGGVRMVYELVGHLNRHGFAAFVVHGKPGFRIDWVKEKVPIVYSGGSMRLIPDDVLIFPEDVETLGQLKGAPVKKIVFCQNHFLTFTRLPAGETWRSLGVSGVLASSEGIAGFLREELGWEHTPVVHYAIDRELFKPAAKKLQVACMPRKLPVEAKFIRGLFETGGGAAKQFQWVDIEGMAREDVARVLSESAIFVSLSNLEGLGLPPLEAMACGCAVVGFHGYGGLEYATVANGFWCRESDPRECLALLRKVARTVVDGDEKLNPVIEAGKQTVAQYTSKRQEEDILRFVAELMAESNPAQS